MVRRVLRLSVWEYNSPNCDSWYHVVIINQRTHVIITNMQSHHSAAHVRFQLSRVGDCSSMIFVRLMESSDEILCAGQCPGPGQ